MDGVKKDDWAKTVQKTLKDKYPNGINVSGQHIDLGKQTLIEMTYSEYTKRIRRSRPQIYADKIHATNNIDEIIEVSSDWLNEGLKHTRNDSIIDFATANVQIRVGENDYLAKVLVAGKYNGSMKVYDIINLKPTRIKKMSLSSEIPETGSRKKELISDNSISNEDAKINRKFSLKEPVEEKGSLVALHNITTSNMLKTLKLGAFPMPSIAVTKADIPHTRFGEITLVMNKSAIDPETDSRNAVYSADAWTPRFPSIKYKANERAVDNLIDMY